jgi:hypothetical protein
VSDYRTPVATLTAPRPVATSTVPGWIVWLMRLVVTLWAVLVFTQQVLAGQFLDANDDLASVHGMNATLVPLIALVMLAQAGRQPASRTRGDTTVATATDRSELLARCRESGGATAMRVLRRRSV